MSTRTKLLFGAGIAGLLTLAVAVGVAGFWFASTAFAQTGTTPPNGAQGSCHDNQSVFQLLGLSQAELLAQRQAGKSLLDIAQAKGVDEAKLTSALLQPMSAMHGGVTNGEQMTQQMRDQFAKDLREPKFGTMTDFHLGLGGNGAGNMMGGTSGTNMMGSTYPNGMMNGNGGMMGNWQ